MSTSRCAWDARDEVFEDYVRGALGPEDRDAFEAHYFECASCFGKVRACQAMRAELGVLAAAEPAPAPVPRRPWRWVLAPLAATCVMVVAAALWFKSPGPPVSPAVVTDAPPATAPAMPAMPPSTGSATTPAAATSPAAPALPVAGSPSRGAVRNAPAPASTPVLLSPADNETRSLEKLDFSWRSVPGAVYYDLHVVTEEGNVVWSGKAEGSSTSLPAGHGLQAGQKYFVWVRAHLSGGGTVKSPAVPFRIGGQ